MSFRKALGLNLENPQKELARIFAGVEDPMREAIAWGSSLAQNAGIDPVNEQILLIREIRKAESRMDLKVATYLSDEIVKTCK